MPSIRRPLFPARHHHRDRVLAVHPPTDVKDRDQATHESALSSFSSSSPHPRCSWIFCLSVALGLRHIVLMATAVFLPKPASRKRWQYQLCWSYWKRSLLRFFFFFFLGFLLGLAPFSDLDLYLDLDSSLSSPIRPNNHLFAHTGTSSSRRELGTILRPQSASSRPTDVTADPTAAAASSKLLIVVTPTYNRALQSYSLHRLGQTLRLVPPPLLWIVVEMGSASDETAEVLRRTGVMHRHLICQKNSTKVKDRGVHQRNTALEHIESHRLDGIIYFADDDNIYSLQLFSKLRDIRRFGTWPVAMLAQRKSKTILEGPVCNGSQVIGWNTNEKSQRLRRFHVDMSGFAFNSTIIWDPRMRHRPTLKVVRQLDTVKEGFQETTFIEQIIEDESQMEGLPEGCSRIMNWHLHLEASNLVYPRQWQVSRRLDANFLLT